MGTVCCAWHVARGWGSWALLVLVVRRLSQNNIAWFLYPAGVPVFPTGRHLRWQLVLIFFNYFVYWGQTDNLRGELMTLCGSHLK